MSVCCGQSYIKFYTPVGENVVEWYDHVKYLCIYLIFGNVLNLVFSAVFCCEK